MSSPKGHKSSSLALEIGSDIQKLLVTLGFETLHKFINAQFLALPET